MAERIRWIHTPQSCAECRHYDAGKKRCKADRCPYPARRGGNGKG